MGKKRSASPGPEEEPPREKRALKALKRLYAAVPVLWKGLEVFNEFMRRKAARRGQRIAEDHAYGSAFESVDFEDDGDLGVLFFHNLHGTPQDYKLLMRDLRRERIPFHAPMLGRERPSPAVQTGFTWERLARQAAEAYGRLAARCGRIIVVGASAGALQAVDVAYHHAVERLVLIAPAFGIVRKTFLKPSTEFWSRVLAEIMPLVPKGKPAHINDPRARAEFKGFSIMAMDGVVAVIDYARHVLAHIEEVRAPVLCLLSDNDHVICVKTAKETVQRFGSEDVRFGYVHESNHMILIDYGREEAARMVLDFILEARGAESQ